MDPLIYKKIAYDAESDQQVGTEKEKSVVENKIEASEGCVE